MARSTLTRFIERDAATLGMVRAGVCSVFLLSVLFTSFENLGRLPATVLRPVGAMQFVPWWFYDALLTPGGMWLLKSAMLVSLGAATVGWLTPVSTKTSVLLVAFYHGLVRSFGHFNHDEMVAIYFLAVLACVPSGKGFAVDARKKPKPRRSFIYGYPIVLMQLLLAWIYFSAAVIKLRVGGLNYFNADNLPALAILHSLDNLHDTEFKLAFYLPAYREYLVPFVALTVVWELLFPLAVFSRRARPFILGFGVVFHVSTLFVMNIFFPYQLLMYMVFVDWRRLRMFWRQRKRRRKLNSRRLSDL